jgi:hypothetical protein
MAFDADEAPSAVMFDELSVEELPVDLPVMCLPTDSLNPAAEVGSERIEVQFQAIAGEYRQTIWSQPFHEIMHDGMGHRLRTRSNFERGYNFGPSIDGEPNPESVGALAGLGAKLIQLDVSELQVPEELLVQ